MRAGARQLAHSCTQHPPVLQYHVLLDAITRDGIKELCARQNHVLLDGITRAGIKELCARQYHVLLDGITRDGI